jgi:uncharacterized protein with FMN-binding domain
MTNDRRPSRLPVRGSLALAVTIGGLALLMGFRTPESHGDMALAIEPGAGDPTSGTTSSTASPAPAGPAATADSSAPPAATLEPTAYPSASTAARTTTGSAFEFRWGIVQVAVTVEGDDIVDVEALQLPDGDRRSLAISQEVEPMLRESALAADSADIDVISGATYTSLAYAYSLQSALDQLAG